MTLQISGFESDRANHILPSERTFSRYPQTRHALYSMSWLWAPCQNSQLKKRGREKNEGQKKVIEPKYWSCVGGKLGKEMGRWNETPHPSIFRTECYFIVCASYPRCSTIFFISKPKESVLQVFALECHPWTSTHQSLIEDFSLKQRDLSNMAATATSTHANSGHSNLYCHTQVNNHGLRP